MEHNNIRVKFEMADYSNLSFSDKEKALLRDLSARMAEIAAEPIMEQKRKLWTDHNMLKSTRPLILCDPENGWNEIIPDSTIQCENSIARYWELHLRKQIYWGEHIKDDYVIEPVFTLPYVYESKTWGVKGKLSDTTRKREVADGGAYHIDASMSSYNELSMVEKEEYTINQKSTDILLATAKEIFNGNLDTCLDTSWFWSFGLTDEAAYLRGMEQMMFDYYDEPENLHKMMAMLRDGVLAKIDYLEQNSLLTLNNDNTYVGSGGLGYTTELPAADFSGKVRTKDMWGLAESQITIGISPDMFEEFVFPYQKPIMERFGLTCYGCCEPMDERFAIVKQVENLRRVSVSAWANKQSMSEQLAHDYIYSYKPTPSDLAVPVMDQAKVRKDIKEALNITRNNCVEIIMKDNHTIGNNPENILNWVKITREEIESM